MENLTDDYYEFIGVKRDANSKEIKDACNKLLMKYHPDKCKEVWADGITKRVLEIKEVLLDTEKRKEYDETLSQPDTESPQPDPEPPQPDPEPPQPDPGPIGLKKKNIWEQLKKKSVFVSICIILIFLLMAAVQLVGFNSRDVDSSQSSDPNSFWENPNYSSIRIGDKYYVPLKPDSNKTAELILNNSDKYEYNRNKFTLKPGEKLDLGQGYSIEAKQVDVDDKNVWLEFTKDGEYISDKIVNVGTDGNTWELKLNGIQGEDDVPVLRVHINQVFQGAIDGTAQIDGLWLIDFKNASLVIPGN